MSGETAGLDYYGPMSFPLRLAGLLLAATLGAQAQTEKTQPPKPESPPASSALSSALFYQLLLGELNLLNQEAGAAFSLLLDAARQTGDARLFQRSVEIALQSRAGDSALQAARAWQKAEPKSRDANRNVLQILIALNRMDEVLEPLKREIRLAAANEREAVINALPRYFARTTNKKQAANLLEQALGEFLNNRATAAAAWTSVGRLRLEAKEYGPALEAARRAQSSAPRAEGPALLALLLMDPARPQAEAMVKKYLETEPARSEMRLEYARRLLEGQRYAEAYEQARQINQQQPEFAEAWLIRGMLELEKNETDAAEQSLQRYVKLAKASSPGSQTEQNRGLVQAFLTLASIAEKRKDIAAAEAWLAQITDPQDMVRVQSRRADLMARQGRLEEGRKLLQALPERTPAQARAKFSAEAQLLREHKQYQAAYDLLLQATQRLPQDHELQYDLATVAEKMGRLEEMERILRGVMLLKPDYAHSYNALGYSLADRGQRLDEARQLIIKALELAPGDPFISDSLGWVEFRRGNLPEAQRILQEAYKKRPDAEIAAHLGEVLWSQGQRDQAMLVWREGLEINADNETLVETLKRLNVKL